MVRLFVLVTVNRALQKLDPSKEGIEKHGTEEE